MTKDNWMMKYNGSTRYWIIRNSVRYKDVGILESHFLESWGHEKRIYILYNGHLTLGYFDTLRAAKQSFALRVKKGGM